MTSVFINYLCIVTISNVRVHLEIQGMELVGDLTAGLGKGMSALFLLKGVEKEGKSDGKASDLPFTPPLQYFLDLLHPFTPPLQYFSDLPRPFTPPLQYFSDLPHPSTPPLQYFSDLSRPFTPPLQYFSTH